MPVHHAPGRPFPAAIPWAACVMSLALDNTGRTGPRNPDGLPEMGKTLYPLTAYLCNIPLFFFFPPKYSIHHDLSSGGHWRTVVLRVLDGKCFS